MAQYADLYTWSHPYGDHVLCHQDGACSVSIAWDGLDAEMLTTSEAATKWQELYTLLSLLGTDYCAEFHYWRESDSSLAYEYLEHGKNMVRGQVVGGAVREALAAHLAPYGMSNRVAFVLTYIPRKRMAFGAKHKLVQQGAATDDLLKAARQIINRLPGGRLQTTNEYARDILQSFHRASFLRGTSVQLDPRFLVSEQLLSEAPRLVSEAQHDATRAASNDKGSLISVAGHLTKVLLVYMYPNAEAAWFTGLAALGIPMHVSQVIIPVDTKQSLRASERDSDLAEGTQGRKGRSEKQKTIDDLNGFQAFVSQNGLGIFKNTYIIHLHGTREELEKAENDITDWIQGQPGGQVRSADYLQLPYFRAGQPGQGYRAPVFRPDHTWLVANMAPVQVYRTGARDPESLRVGASGALIGFNTSKLIVPHSMTVAMTRAGKGVEKVAQIAETYPFGIDWYIAEIGGSYKWIVEAFGGTYSKIDPSDTVVNPLPPYNVADFTADRPLDATLAGGTINALSFLLTDGAKDDAFTIHHAAAAQDALQMLYAVAPDGREAPTLADLLQELQNSQREIESEPQREAAHEMAQNLDSFLSTTEGRIFSRPDNLVLSQGITGVDLKDVDRASPKLLQFYLVFLALRFNHLSFARRTPSRTLLDELHKFVKVSPVVMGRLISELARMGGKDAAAIDLVTQGVMEIDAIEKEVLNSMPFRTLLYRADEWDHIASRIDMPQGPLNIWKSFPYPMNFPYRPAMRSVDNEYYNLHLTFPNILLDLSATSPDDLNLKDQIGLVTSNPMERLRLFREAKEKK